SRESCWVIINGIVYDLTSFLDSHPAGPAVILRYAGRDATAAFEPLHPKGILETYLKKEVKRQLPAIVADQTQENTHLDKKIRIRSIITLSDFEKAAAQRLPARTFVFMAGADDEFTKHWNQRSWQIVRFRPRILRPVTSVDLVTSIFGNKYSVPFFISPAGGGKLAHPTGEVLLTRAAARHGVLHWVCNMAGSTKEELAAARVSDQTLHWQIYARSDLSVTEREIREAIALGYKGFALTVDAIRGGKRTRDLRLEVDAYEDADDEEKMAGGISAQRGTLWQQFDWISAIKWLRGMTDLPIAIKGIQCWEDAVLCMRHGVHPWLSNHGGRQLEGAPSAMETLVEIRLNCPEVLENCEVIVDGGITKGTDVVKALALGARAVGVGRPFLYSLVFGEAGPNKAIKILQEEIETAISLLGVTSIEQLNESYVTLRQQRL
ncbi:FMN-dependent dehydrogenase-domain-containing protein, partial [Xylariales sp. PMI_506]